MSLKIKLVLLYILAAILSMFIVSIFIVYRINYTGIQIIEKQLIEQSNTANSYITKSIFLKNSTLDELDKESIHEIMQNLAFTQGIIKLYNTNREMIGTSKPQNLLPAKDYQSLFSNSLKGNHSYIVKSNYIYFMSPIILDNKTVGYFEIDYELKFLNQILKNVMTTLVLGSILFCILLIIASTLITRKIYEPIKLLLVSTELFAKRIFTPINIKRNDEIGKLAKSFNSMGMQLQKYLNTQKDFVSNVSHELNTPLTAIKGYGEIIYDEAHNNDKLKKAAYHLKNETNRLSSLVKNLLSLSRMDSNKEELIMQEINLSNILNETIEKLKIKSKSYDIKINSNVLENVQIIADKKKIVQVFINLIDNSIKYSPKNGEIYINLNKDNHYAIIIIEDNGIGIPENELKNIFERFYRCDNAKNVTGTGLGLALSKEIIERHKGNLKLANKKPSGIKVTITLPIYNPYKNT